MRRGKVSKAEVRYRDNGIRMRVGTLDKKQHDVIYVDMSTYLKPIENKMSYIDDIKYLRVSMGKRMSDIIKKDGRFSKDFIFNFDISDSRIKYGKKTFLTMMTVMRFRQHDDNKIMNILPQLKDTIVKEMRNSIDDELSDMFEYEDIR